MLRGQTRADSGYHSAPPTLPRYLRGATGRQQHLPSIQAMALPARPWPLPPPFPARESVTTKKPKPAASSPSLPLRLFLCLLLASRSNIHRLGSPPAPAPCLSGYDPTSRTSSIVDCLSFCALCSVPPVPWEPSVRQGSIVRPARASCASCTCASGLDAVTSRCTLPWHRRTAD